MTTANNAIASAQKDVVTALIRHKEAGNNRISNRRYSVLFIGSDWKRDIEMDWEKVAGILGAIVAAIVMVTAIAFGPIGQFGKPQKPLQKTERPNQPAAASAAPRGPVVREVPQ